LALASEAVQGFNPVRIARNDGDLPGDGGVLAGLADDRSWAQVDELTYLDHVQSFDRFTELLRSTGNWSNPHPWLLTFLPGSAAEQIASDILDEVAPNDLGDYGLIVFYPITTEQITTPLFRLPAEDVVFPFNLIRLPSDPAQANRPVNQNRALYDRACTAGGVLYPVSGFPLSPVDWREHFGDHWPAVLTAKERFDPRRRLTPGQGLFVPDDQCSSAYDRQVTGLSDDHALPTRRGGRKRCGYGPPTWPGRVRRRAR
jgi:cytokinin dehydrogenase